MFKKLFRKVIYPVMGLAIVMMNMTPAYASKTDVHTGGIAVDTNTYTLDANGNRTSDMNFGELQPGQTEDYIIEVSLPSTSKSAYIRVKMDYGSFSQEDNILQNVSSDWVYTNGYYYYKNILNGGQAVDLCNKIKIPDIDSWSGGSFSIASQAEAIQSANFTPDFTANDPWFGEKTEANKTPVAETSKSKYVQLLFDSNLKGAADKAQLFTSKSDMMAGDSVTETLKIIPDYTGKVSLTGIYSDEYPEESDLIKLTIKNGNTTLYDGSLFSSSLKGGISLGTFTKGQSTNLTFTLSLSTKLTNESTWMTLPVELSFAQSVEPVVNNITNNNTTNNTTNNNSGVNGVNRTDSDGDGDADVAGVLGAIREDIPSQGVLGAIRTNVATGDNLRIFIGFCMAMVSLIALIILGAVEGTKYVKNRRVGGNV